MPYIYNKYYPLRNVAFFMGEGLLITTTFIFVNWAFKGTAIFMLEIPECIPQVLLVTAVFQLCLYFFDLYELRENLPLPATATRITQAFGIGCIFLGVFYYVIPTVTIPTKIFWTSYFILYLFVLLWRTAYIYILQRKMFVQEIEIPDL